MKTKSTGIRTHVTVVDLDLPEYGDVYDAQEEFEEVNVEDILDILAERGGSIQVEHKKEEEEGEPIKLLVPYKSNNPER